MSGKVWDELLGQPEAIEQLTRVVENRESGVHHAWLFTGPHGSGRSNLAVSFAAALECESAGCGACQSCRLVVAGAHPDVTLFSTDRVQISIDEVRELVSKASLSTTLGKYRVLIIEDADRMTERTSNVLLKELEEPSENTIWILCAPSVSDLLPTIRSRTRNLNLRLPSTEEVAQLLHQRDGIGLEVARTAARQAQNHVGMARRLATNAEVRNRRSDTIALALGISNLSSAMMAADRFLQLAKKDAEQVSADKDEQEKTALLAAFGFSEGDKLPPSVRSSFKDLEENQKRRQTRLLRDGLDRILTDLESIYRDVLSIQLESGTELYNPESQEEISARAQSGTAEQTIAVLDGISQARARLASNVRDLLVLEALCVKLIFRRSRAN
ncbi:MAG: DNA polymerase III subunit delta' [Actinobacteria bacterium]|nr:DNA polymerase III subunit delta' [Actinomycetota bacterium]